MSERTMFILLKPKKYCQLTDDPCIEHEEGCDSCPISVASDTKRMVTE